MSDTNKEDTNKSPDASTNMEKPGMWSRFRSEFSISSFALEEDYFGRLDLLKSFCLSADERNWAVIAFKFITVCLSISGFVLAIARQSVPGFYPAYLTFWGVVYGIIYLSSSFTLAVKATSSPEDSRLIKFTWAFFLVPAVHGMIIAPMYWIFLWTPGPVEYSNVMMHGGVAALVLIDGLIINKTPVRIKHAVIVLMFALLWLFWSILQNAVIQYNPGQDDDDDALYDIMKWREETVKSIILASIVVFVAIPLFTCLIWRLSLSGRCYIDPNSGESGESYAENAHDPDLEIADQMDEVAAA